MSEPSQSDQSSGPFPCEDCQAGVMRLRFITYFAWIGEELILVPNFPAWICDVCGRRDYDEKSLSWLSMLLSPEAGKPSRPKLAEPHRSRRPASRATPQS